MLGKGAEVSEGIQLINIELCLLNRHKKSGIKLGMLFFFLAPAPIGKH